MKLVFHLTYTIMHGNTKLKFRLLLRAGTRKTLMSFYMFQSRKII